MKQPPRKIPIERVVFSRERFVKGDHYVERGARRDMTDAVVKAAPEMFELPDGTALLDRPDLFDPEAA